MKSSSLSSLEAACSANISSEYIPSYDLCFFCSSHAFFCSASTRAFRLNQLAVSCGDESTRATHSLDSFRLFPPAFVFQSCLTLGFVVYLLLEPGLVESIDNNVLPRHDVYFGLVNIRQLERIGL